MKNIRTLAEGVDQSNEQLSRTFIVPEERPDVGSPPPQIEELKVPKISAAEAKIGQEKTAFTDGRKEIAFSREAEELDNLLHSISRSGGKLEVTGTAARAGRRRSEERRRAGGEEGEELAQEVIVVVGSRHDPVAAGPRRVLARRRALLRGRPDPAGLGLALAFGRRGALGRRWPRDRR